MWDHGMLVPIVTQRLVATPSQELDEEHDDRDEADPL